MIDFKKLNIDNNIINEITTIANSCGVVTCYILSLVYGFKFDIEEFKNIGLGLTEKKIQQYAAKNKVNYSCKENNNNKTKIGFADFDILCKSDIVMTLAGANTNNNGSHTSIISSFKNDTFTQLFCNPLNCKTKFSEVENIYITFYYKNCDIGDFVIYE